MRFNSVQYALFLGVLVLVYWRVPTRYRRYLLLLASYGFYASFGRLLPLILAGMTLVTYFCAHALYQSWGARIRWLVVGLAGTLGVLIAFKLRASFLGDSGDTTSQFAVTNLGGALAIPVGLSFYTFQAVSHLVDVSRGEAEPESLVDTALYLAFFPHLLAGPILRSRRLVPAFHNIPDHARQRQIREGTELLLTGLFRKVALADPFLRFFSYRLVDADQIGSVNLLLLLVAVIIAGYFDVSGYVDMARGSAKLLGIDMQPNFAQPLTRSRNWTEFWRRWQITTMAWFRDYTFRPLRGRNASETRERLALIGTFITVGLWHGLAANFVLWSVITVSLLIAEREWQARKRQRLRRERRRTGRRRAPEPQTWWTAAKGPLYVAGCLLVTMPWLVAADLSDGANVYRRLLELKWVSIETDIIFYAVLLLGSLFLLDQRERVRDKLGGRQPLTLARTVGFSAMVTLIVIYSGSPTQQFVYFRF